MDESVDIREIISILLVPVIDYLRRQDELDIDFLDYLQQEYQPEFRKEFNELYDELEQILGNYMKKLNKEEK